ncbi:QCR10 [Auxenochlorella protothecoides x Auxenochlorella symbiontica]
MVLGGVKSAVSRLTPSPGAVQSLALWGTTAGVGALWLVQPFDFIKGLLEDKPAEE